MSAVDLASELATCPAASTAAAVIGPAGVLAIHNPAQRYPWASVTKIATALTILDAVEEGVVALSDPAGPPGATLGDLLCHTSGYTFDSSQAITRPRTHRIYSNAGYDAAAAHLVATTGRPFTVDLHERVLDLLDMHEATLDGPPSRGMTGTITDLAAMAHELLMPRLLLPNVVRRASTTVEAELDGVLPGFGRQNPNPWGYGCEIRGHKQPHWTAPDNSPATFGHFGMAGSFCWIDPQAQLACVFLGDRNFGSWAADWWPGFSGRVLAAFAS